LIRQKWLDNDFYGFIAALHYEKPKTGLVVGGGWNRYLGDHFGHIAWARFPSESTPGWRYYDNTGSKTDYSIFLRANRLISNNLNLYLDLQYRSISYAIHGTHDDLRDITQEHNFSFFNPKAGIHYELDKNNSFYIAVGASNREPNRSVYRDADEGQEIHSEQLVDLEIGHRYRQQRWIIESNIYNMAYKNQLVLTGRINNVGAPILTNVPESYRRGIEVSIHFKPLYNFEISGNLTLSSNKIADFTEYVDNWNYWDNPETEPYQYVFNLGKTDISFSPAIIAGGSLGYRPIPGASVLFSTNYISRQYLDNTSNADRSLNPYLVTDLSMAYELKQNFARQLSITLHLNNIFNQLYEANGWVYRYIYDGQSSVMDGYFPQAGFHWMASVKIGI
jgi:iron complex outermembrane receptor protein